MGMTFVSEVQSPGFISILFARQVTKAACKITLKLNVGGLIYCYPVNKNVKQQKNSTFRYALSNAMYGREGQKFQTVHLFNPFKKLLSAAFWYVRSQQ